MLCCSSLPFKKWLTISVCLGLRDFLKSGTFHAKIGDMGNSRKREKNIAKSQHKVQVYSYPPNKTITQGKWSAQMVAFIYNPVSSCYFEYSLPTFSSFLLQSVLWFCHCFLFVVHISSNTELFLWTDWNRFRYILLSALIYLCLDLFKLFSSISYYVWFFFFFTSWFIFHFI